MTTPSNTSNGADSSWGSAGTIAGGAAKGGLSAYNSQAEGKEAKRRTLAKLLKQSMNRNMGLFQDQQNYNDEMNNFQSQAMQQVARGFVDALQGSTGRG